MSTPDPPQNPAPASGAPSAEADAPDAPGAPDAAGAAPDTPPAGAEPAGSSPPRRRRGRRWPHALSLLTWALLVIGLPLAAGWALLHDPRALPLLLQLAPGIKAEGVAGTLAGGQIRMARLDWSLPAQSGQLHLEGLAIDGLELRQAPHAGAWLALHWTGLSADAARYTSGPPPTQPRRPPTDLRSPVVIDGLPLRVGQLDIDALPRIRDAQARLSIGVDGGRQHRLDGLTLALPWARVQGRASLGTTAPLPVTAVVTAASLPLPVGAAAAPRPGLPPPLAAWQASANATGPLDRLAVEAELHGQALAGHPAPALQASATVAAFAPWPLAALSVSTQALDLSALAPTLPHTLLDGRASVQTSGLDQPLSVQASIVNRQPGALDGGRVPLRRLTVSLRGELAHTDRLTLERFDLLLGDAKASAGQASGSGRWRGDTLALDLLLDDLQPARLHGAAAALSISGPLSLQLRGLLPPGASAAAGQRAADPQVELKATLSGRALDGSGLPVKLHVEGGGTARHLIVRQAEASAGDAQASFNLDAQAQPGGWQLRGAAHLSRFDPLPWWRGDLGTAWRRGPHRINADLKADLLWRGMPAQGLLLDQLLLAADGNATLHLADSVVAGVPVEGDWTLRNEGRSEGRQVSLVTRTAVGGNTLAVEGRGGGAPAGDRWQVRLDFPTLATLQPLRTLAGELAPDSAAEIAAWWPAEGQAEGRIELQGRWPALRTQGEVKVSALKAPSLLLREAKANWRTSEEVDAPLLLDLDALGLQVAGQRIDRLQAQANGKLRQHALHFLVDSPLQPPAWTENLLGPAGSGTRLEGRAQGSWTPADGGGGVWRMSELRLDGGARDAQGGSRAWLAGDGLAAELRLNREGDPQALTVAPGRLALLTTALRWREAQWQAGSGAAPGRLSVLGELETIDLSRLLSRMQPDVGWGGDLTLAGRFELHAAERLDADVVLERRGGDLTVGDEFGTPQGLGIGEMRLALSAHDGVWQFAQGMAGRALGEMAGAQVLQTVAGKRWPSRDSPLTGVLEARVSTLGIWGTWVPPGWRLGGTLRTNASLGGTLGAPELRGAMHGQQLSVRNVLQGVHLSDGELDISLAGETARVERLMFKGGDGQLTITGGATLGATPQARLSLDADHFRVLGRIDRRIVASGQATMQLDAQQLKLDGRLVVDDGLIDISQSDAPKLDSDVVVRRSSDTAVDRPAHAAGPLPAPLRNARVTLALNLGQKLRLRGRGTDTLLRGDLQVGAAAGNLTLAGTVNGDGGTYAAYGQSLEITRGDLVFSGALDNPRLDIQATRPNLDVVVGVAITGPALNPRVRLFSEPELAEYDKLSWLVLGRSPDGLGRTDTALLQRAAMALLSGDSKAPTDELLGALGLTDFSLRQTEGTVRETVVSLGKQLSRRWYVGYERSVNATTGTWQLVYRVAQRFTLRAQSGTENAVDAIWSWRW